MDTSESLLTLAILLVLAIVVLLVVREIVLWYYKINERVEIQKQSLGILHEIRDLLDKEKSEADTTTSLNNTETMSKLEQQIKDKS